MAWEIWEKLGYSDMDPSTLSKILTGKRLFTSKQINQFCKTLNLNNLEKRLLLKTYNEDLLSKYNFSSELIGDYKEILKLLEYQYDLLKDSPSDSLPLKYGRHLSQLLDFLECTFMFDDNTKFGKQILELYGDLLFRYIHAVNNCLVLKQSIKESKVIENKLKRLYLLTKDKKYLHHSLACRAFSLHVQNKHPESYKVLENVEINTFNELWKATYIENYLASQIEKNKKINDSSKEIILSLESYSKGLQVSIYNRIARTLLQINQVGEAQLFFEKTLKLFSKIVTSDLDYSKERKIQIACTHCVFLKSGANLKEKVKIKDQVQEALLVAQERGYVRHEMQLKNNIERI